MLKALRNIDRLYFGSRVGRGGAAHAAVWLLTGGMPLSFASRYVRGELDSEIESLCK